MPEIQDAALINKLLRATRRGKIAWETTGTHNTFLASYGGKWALTVNKTEGPHSEDSYYLTINNPAGDEILRIWDQPDNDLITLFEQVRRYALKVDEALSDLLKEIGEEAGPETKGPQTTGPEITDEDIPF